MVNDAQKKEENKKNSQTHPLNSLRSAVQCQTTRQLIHQVVARQHFPFAHAAWPCCFERNCKNIWWLWKGTICVFDWKWSFTFIWHYDRWLPFQSHKITNIIISNLFAGSADYSQPAKIVEIYHHGVCCAYHHWARKDNEYFDEFYNGTTQQISWYIYILYYSNSRYHAQQISQLYHLPGGRGEYHDTGEVLQSHLQTGTNLN